MNSDSDGDFGFAFNNVHFSDRLLRIEITRGGQVSCSSIVDWVPYRTRRREDGIQFSAKVLAFATCQVESDLNKYSCERKYEKNKNKHEEATVTTKQETESGGEDENESHYCGMSTNPSLIRVIELHISSPILAAKSPFFYKMGMESSSYSDFGFAFNNVTFSDRLLRIEITHGGSEFSCSSIVHRKRKRDDVQNQTHVLDLADTCQVESDLNNNERHVKDENECRYWSTMTTNPSVLRVKELHISSPILAAKSPFFYKLFSNGMLESGQKHLTLRIEESEEAAVMELLHFMYRNSLSVTETPALLNVLMAADKFEVASCLKYCSCLLLNMPMTLDSALLLLDLPSTVLMADPVKLLINAAKQFLTSRYKNITKFNLEEVTALPLVGIKAILASNDLKLRSEDIVYDVVLSWAKKHYSVVEERQEILRSHLARYIRFPHMTCRRLRRISASDDFKPSVASKLVLEALFFKAESLHNRRVLAAEKYASLDNWFVERAYKFKPIKIMEFEVPRRQCIVYLDLTRKECDAIYPSSKIYSQVFHFEGQGFVLSAYCSKGPQNLFHCFGLFLGMHEKGSVSLTVDYEFSARSKPTEDFDMKYKGSNKFQAGKCVRYWNFFATPWDSFIAKDSPFFINDILHLRAELSIRL